MFILFKGFSGNAWVLGTSATEKPSKKQIHSPLLKCSVPSSPEIDLRTHPILVSSHLSFIWTCHRAISHFPHNPRYGKKSFHYHPWTRQLNSNKWRSKICFLNLTDGETMVKQISNMNAKYLSTHLPRDTYKVLKIALFLHNHFFLKLVQVFNK